MKREPRLYDKARWKRLRLVKLAGEPLCRYCAALGYTQTATVVDHIVPHKGNEALFWDMDNMQSLCADCHASAKQRAERGVEVVQVGLDGWPVTPH